MEHIREPYQQILKRTNGDYSNYEQPPLFSKYVHIIKFCITPFQDLNHSCYS